MSDQKNENLMGRLPELYAELRPALVGIAFRYKLHNPNEFADEWLAKAYVIVDKFDKGQLNKKVHSEDEDNQELVAYDPDVHSDKALNKALKAYLKKSFVHDVIKQYHKNKRHTTFQKTYADQYSSVNQGGYSSVDSFLHYDSVFIEDVISLLELDIARIEKNSTSILDMVTHAFLKAMNTHCNEMKKEYGSFIVVKDIDISDNKRFFSDNFRTDLEEGVRKKICDLILEETNPLLIEKLSYLIDPKKRGTLQKRLFRYLFEYHNGYPKRLRNRIKSKTLR